MTKNNNFCINKLLVSLYDLMQRDLMLGKCNAKLLPKTNKSVASILFSLSIDKNERFWCE
jgi:hypothetical protein